MLGVYELVSASIDPAGAVLGGVFGLLLGVFTVALRILNASGSRVDRRADAELARVQAAVQANIDSLTKDRDYYRDRYLALLEETRADEKGQDDREPRA